MGGAAQFKIIGDGEARRPEKAHPGDAGWDLFTSKHTKVPAGRSVDVPTGIAVALPEGYYGHIISRSSTPDQHNGLQVQEAVVDNGYRGEMFVMAYNPGPSHSHPIHVPAGARIAQLLILPIPEIRWEQTDELPESDRGTKAFGSSGR